LGKRETVTRKGRNQDPRDEDTRLFAKNPGTKTVAVRVGIAFLRVKETLNCTSHTAQESSCRQPRIKRINTRAIPFSNWAGRYRVRGVKGVRKTSASGQENNNKQKYCSIVEIEKTGSILFGKIAFSLRLRGRYCFS